MTPSPLSEEPKMTRTTLLLAGLLTLGTSAAQAQGVPRVVSGRIFDDSTGCPLRAVQVAAAPGVHVLTDVQGRYRMGNLPSGAFTLTALLRGYQPNNVDSLVVSDSSTRVDFSLIRAAADSVKGTEYPPRTCRLEPRDSTRG